MNTLEKRSEVIEKAAQDLATDIAGKERQFLEFANHMVSLSHDYGVDHPDLEDRKGTWYYIFLIQTQIAFPFYVAAKTKSPGKRIEAMEEFTAWDHGKNLSRSIALLLNVLVEYPKDADSTDLEYISVLKKLAINLAPLSEEEE